MLEEHAWPRYGAGLWDEPWSEFYSRLAKAVQPYAHCSPELLQWNLAAVTGLEGNRFVGGVGLYDAVKASRLTLFHVLVCWTLGRILFTNQHLPTGLVTFDDVRSLGSALVRSDLLIESKDWSVQLWPHMFFKR